MFIEERSTSSPYSIAIVGCGPRGISVLERLAVLLSSSQKDGRQYSENLVIHVIDAIEIGAGRIWSKNQPSWLLMNTPARETTMFSGSPDEYEARPGAGPSLSQWWLEFDHLNAEPDGLAPRAVYGKYLHFVFKQIVDNLSKYATVNLVEDTAIDLRRTADMRWKIILQKHPELIANRVVLTTGHSLTELDKTHHEFQKFSKRKQGKKYIRGDSAADMNLAEITPHSNVGIMGCGLAFYDVVISLTEGRGGRFRVKEDGQYAYVPSGLEPKIYAGSRSGVPFPARAVNEKPADFLYTPSLFTANRMLRLRDFREQGKLHFREDVLPWLEAEMQLVYVACTLRARFGEIVAREFTEKTLGNIHEDIKASQAQQIILQTATLFGLSNVLPVELYKWSRPFQGRTFNNSIEYASALKEWIGHDISNAIQGNLTSPFKAATDVLRDVRPILKLAVDYGGLTPESHRDDFLGCFVPIYSMLSAGPPVKRLRQILALIESGLLTLAGPGAQFSVSDLDGGFLIDSADVSGSEYLVDTLIDARIPTPNVRIDISNLTKCLLQRGILTSFTHSLGTVSFDTGGVAVTAAPFHPITSSGVEKSLYVLGIPTEHTRWLMHVGSGRPGKWGQFTQDANAIANDLMSAITDFHEEHTYSDAVTL